MVKRSERSHEEVKGHREGVRGHGEDVTGHKEVRGYGKVLVKRSEVTEKRSKVMEKRLMVTRARCRGLTFCTSDSHHSLKADSSRQIPPKTGNLTSNTEHVKSDRLT